MAHQVQPIRRVSSTPDIRVLVNGAWVSIKDTPWADCMKQAGFKAAFSYMKNTGKPGQWHDRWFKLFGRQKSVGI